MSKHPKKCQMSSAIGAQGRARGHDSGGVSLLLFLKTVGEIPNSRITFEQRGEPSGGRSS